MLPGYFANFATVVRCMVTKFGYGKDGKPLVRTVVFNLVRQFFPMLWTPIFIDFKMINNFLGVVRKGAA